MANKSSAWISHRIVSWGWWQFPPVIYTYIYEERDKKKIVAVYKRTKKKNCLHLTDQIYSLDTTLWSRRTSLRPSSCQRSQRRSERIKMFPLPSKFSAGVFFHPSLGVFSSPAAAHLSLAGHNATSTAGAQESKQEMVGGLGKLGGPSKGGLGRDVCFVKSCGGWFIDKPLQLAVSNAANQDHPPPTTTTRTCNPPLRLMDLGLSSLEHSFVNGSLWHI